jgi:thiol-disulfide isomerase/thioredoxin
MTAALLGSRLALAGLIVLACGAAWFAVQALVLRRAGRAASLLPFTPGLPGVVLFTTPDCAACKTQQRPALRELANRLTGRIQVIEIDAVEKPELARRWSVLSVPTTFVLDRAGRPLHVNHGVASVRKLMAQLPAGT